MVAVSADDRAIVRLMPEEQIRQQLEAAFAIISELPADWQTAIWDPLAGLFPAVQAMQQRLIEQEQVMDRQSFALQHQDDALRDLRQRLEKARERSIESVIADATIQTDLSATDIQLFLDILRGEYAPLLGKYRMADLEGFVQEFAGEVYEYQQLLEAEARQLDPDFDPDDNYDPE
jgi:hypothetical protein